LMDADALRSFEPSDWNASDALGHTYDMYIS
jgi:hypothetical protein